MSKEAWEIEVERVVVALDASEYGLAALEAAAHLATELRAELQGLFVEDIDLLRLAALPFAREFAYSSAPRRLDPATMERSLRATAETARRALESAAGRTRLQWSFRVTRGRVVREALAAAAEADLLIVGRECRLPGAGPAGRGPGRGAARGTGRGQGPVLVVYDGSPSGRRALAAAAHLAMERGKRVAVAVAAPPRQVKQLRREALDWLTKQGLAAEAPEIPVSDATGLLDAAWQHCGCLLVLNRDSALLDERVIDALVNKLDCPVGLVR